jgi:hypothetical protein
MLMRTPMGSPGLRIIACTLGRVVAFQTNAAMVRAIAREKLVAWRPPALQFGNLLAQDSVKELSEVLEGLIRRTNALARNSSWIRSQDREAARSGVLKRIDTATDVRSLARFQTLASFAANRGLFEAWQVSADDRGKEGFLQAPITFERMSGQDLGRAAQTA